MNVTGIFHAPPVEEIQSRVARVQAEMARNHLDWYVCFSPDNIYYLTNFANAVHERPFILLVPASGIPRFVAPLLEIPHIERRRIGDVELVDYFEFPAPAGHAWSDRLTDILVGASRVGVESISQVQIYQAIAAEKVTIDIVDELRMIKSPYEIGRMIYSAEIVNAAIADLLSNVKQGRSQREVMAAGSQLMMSRLLQDNPSINPFATKIYSVFQSPHYADDPHNFSDLHMRMVAGGPHVSIINAVLNGYGSEVERNFFIGHVPEAAKAPYQTMLEGRQIILDMVKPGIRMRDVDKAANDHFKARGYAANLRHRAGHGMGVTGHEAPFLAEGETRVLKAGMTLTVEPGIYIAGVGGFRHSDTILVTEGGNVLLTQAPDALEELVF